jgi:2-polyprenyl-3-methyl-5-hydroxy-6-metoxy-1,4-benzoquinol methylase
MANFAPMKKRFLLVLEDSLRLFSIRGRFLDYGCGSGDVSEFLIRDYGLQEGIGYDPALEEAEVLKRNSRQGVDSLKYSNKLDESAGEFDLAILFDVIEHIPNVDNVLQEIQQFTRDGGWLAVTVPYNAREWGNDDDFYGHLRRLSWRGIVTMLENNGWNVIRVLDPTFPSFWFVRRVYLLVARLTKRFPSHRQDQARTEMDKTLVSSRRSAWDTQGRMSRLLSASLVPWRIIRRFDLYFESIFFGFELFVLCQKGKGTRICEVCANGLYTYHKLFDRYSLQKCRYCGSEKILPEIGAFENDSRTEKKQPPFLEKILEWLQRHRIRQIEQLDTPEKSLLDIRSARGKIPAHFKRLGWRALATVLGAESKVAAEKAGADVVETDLMQLSNSQRYGVITLHHVIEHVSNLQQALNQLDRLLLPGGYLILEYPNGSSLLKRLLGWRWFGYDPPFHRLQINPQFLADYLGMMNYRLLRESHFSMDYSLFIFAQSWVNVLLPFQRDAMYKLLRASKMDLVEKVSSLLSLPLFLGLAVIFLVYQPLVSLFRCGCVVRQLFKKAYIGERLATT